jgi:hypothetical protein
VTRRGRSGAKSSGGQLSSADRGAGGAEGGVGALGMDALVSTSAPVGGVGALLGATVAPVGAGSALTSLSWEFGAPAGLEPATYGLEVDPRPSMVWRRVSSFLVRSVQPSSWYGLAMPCGPWRNDQRNDRRSPPAEVGTVAQ